MVGKKIQEMLQLNIALAIFHETATENFEIVNDSVQIWK